jgi:hypothetical protein
MFSSQGSARLSSEVPTEAQGQAEHMREALKEEEQLLIITRLHQVRAGSDLQPRQLKYTTPSPVAPPD